MMDTIIRQLFCRIVLATGGVLLPALAVPAANALGSLSVSREEQGSAAALLAAAPPAGFIFGPLIGAMLYSFMPELPLYVSAGLVGTLAVYAVIVTSKGPLTPS